MPDPVGLCFTIKYRGLSNTLNAEVEVESAVMEGRVKALSLWDTGATSTVITPDTAQRLGLEHVTVARMVTPSGTMECKQYAINLYLPNTVIVRNILVSEAMPAGCDMLIGMDVIGLGDFAVSHFDDKTMFSFRVPSMQHIDFTKHSYSLPFENSKQGRNEECGCGSGKKYKNCCGRGK
jgi:predicted aspartyl protease